MKKNNNMTPVMHPVVSSNISTIGYDEDTQELYIEFKKSTYKYDNVPKKIFDELFVASSAGLYYLNNIRGIYNGTKI